MVRIFPCFDRGGPRRETFFQQQLMMQCNWRDLNDLNPENESWEVVYNRRFGVQTTPDNVDDDVSSVSSEDSNRSSQERDEWMDLSNMGPEAHFTAREPGTREFDTSFEWTDSYRNYPGILEIGSFLGNCKRDHLQSQSDLSASSLQFSEEQENILRSMIEEELTKKKQRAQEERLQRKKFWDPTSPTSSSSSSCGGRSRGASFGGRGPWAHSTLSCAAVIQQNAIWNKV